jgi:hypothetical protein
MPVSSSSSGRAFLQQVYDAYWHAFNTVRGMAPVQTRDENNAFNAVLQRLVDEHGAHLPLSWFSFEQLSATAILHSGAVTQQILDMIQ